jgi:preprotein translocase subunit SecA
MADRPAGRSPAGAYPLPAAPADGPLLRAAAGASLRWRAAFPRWRARSAAAEGEAVARHAANVAALPMPLRREMLAAVRGRLRRDPDHADIQRESLALAGGAWTDGLAPSGLEYAAALATMRGQLVAIGAAPDPERVVMLAAMAAAPWGGGVHVVLRDGERAAAFAARLQRCCGPLALAVGLVEPGAPAAARRDAWAADITCAGVGELVTDALRDLKRLPDRPGDLRLRLERLHGVNPRAGELLQRGLRSALLLDADALLLDEALRTVAISADESASKELQALALAWDVAAICGPGSGLAGAGLPGAGSAAAAIALNDAGRQRLAEMLAQRGGPWSSPRWREHRIELALLARYVLEAGTHYDATGPRIAPIEPALSVLVPDPFEQRLVLDLLAIRHDREVPRSGVPVASMSFMECFMRYTRLGGTIRAADRLAVRELRDLYGLAVLPLAEGVAVAAIGAEAGALSPADRALMARARAEHRGVAGRLHKLLAFSGG